MRRKCLKKRKNRKNKLEDIGMKKIAIFIAVALFLSFNGNSLAQNGKIWGYVYNGTQDSSRLANAKIEILVYSGHGLVDDSSYVTKSDRRGRFQLANLKLDTTLVYYPRTTFSDIVYYGHGVRLTEDSPVQQSDIVVYDSTKDKSNIVIQMDHIFLEERDDKISFRETVILSNNGKKTYTGEEMPGGGHYLVLEFPLPHNAENVQLLSQESQASMFVDKGRLIDTALFPPGMRQISYQFEVPKQGKVWHFSRNVLFPTMSANIFISQPRLIVEGPGIQPMGEFPIRNVNYQRYMISHSMPGTPLQITLKNLSGKAIPIQWIVLGLVAISLLIGFGYTMLRPAKK